MKKLITAVLSGMKFALFVLAICTIVAMFGATSIFGTYYIAGGVISTALIYIAVAFVLGFVRYYFKVETRIEPTCHENHGASKA